MLLRRLRGSGPSCWSDAQKGLPDAGVLCMVMPNRSVSLLHLQELKVSADITHSTFFIGQMRSLVRVPQFPYKAGT